MYVTAIENMDVPRNRLSEFFVLLWLTVILFFEKDDDPEIEEW
ncbi:MAG: hypothetical protein V1907_03745 [Candidatus Kerfeldbacteria bacterium]